MDLTFKLDSFEGPLDLMEHLIKKNKLNICSVSLIAITDQYIEYVNGMKEMNQMKSKFIMVIMVIYMSFKALKKCV